MAMRADLRRGHKQKHALAIGLTLVTVGLASGWPTASGGAVPQSTSSPAIAEQRMDARALFAKGQTELQAGDLDAAEAAFRQVLSVVPRAGSAYANLGVFSMRCKEWARAFTLTRKAA